MITTLITIDYSSLDISNINKTIKFGNIHQNRTQFIDSTKSRRIFSSRGGEDGYGHFIKNYVLLHPSQLKYLYRIISLLCLLHIIIGFFNIYLLFTTNKLQSTSSTKNLIFVSFAINRTRMLMFIQQKKYFEKYKSTIIYDIY